MTALWIYISQREGSINLSESGILFTPQMLGALSGASIEALLATIMLENGKIDLKKWQSILKIILGALVILLFAFAVSFMIVGSTFAIMALIISVFGDSIIGAFVYALLTLPIVIYILSAYEDWQDDILDFLGDLYDKYIGPVTDKVMALIKKLKVLAEKAVQLVQNMKENGQQINVETYPQHDVTSEDEVNQQLNMA